MQALGKKAAHGSLNGPLKPEKEYADFLTLWSCHFGSRSLAAQPCSSTSAVPKNHHQSIAVLFSPALVSHHGIVIRTNLKCLMKLCTFFGIFHYSNEMPWNCLHFNSEEITWGLRIKIICTKQTIKKTDKTCNLGCHFKPFFWQCTWKIIFGINKLSAAGSHSFYKTNNLILLCLNFSYPGNRICSQFLSSEQWSGVILGRKHLSMNSVSAIHTLCLRKQAVVFRCSSTKLSY